MLPFLNCRSFWKLINTLSAVMWIKWNIFKLMSEFGIRFYAKNFEICVPKTGALVPNGRVHSRLTEQGAKC